MKKALIPMTILATLAVAGQAQAHDGVASGTCQGGVQWNYHNYHRDVINTIVVTIDGVVRYTDLDFKASDAGTIATDKTIPHTWKVDVDAPGTQYDKHPSGSYPACVTVPSTTNPATTIPNSTTIPPQTTTTAPNTASTVQDSTTTSVVEVGPPPVPPTTATPATFTDVVVVLAEEPVLPVTGGTDWIIIAVAGGIIVVGVFLVRRGRRVP